MIKYFFQIKLIFHHWELTELVSLHAYADVTARFVL